jgi:glyoxylase-like metal-dependent hydrolase (beta-lactamase superfamily II)
MAANPTAISRTEIEDLTNTVRKVTIVSITVLGKYRVNAQINDQNLIEDVMTWIPDPVLGDMLYEARYTEYKDFNGVKFPTLLHYHRGNRFLDLGHDVLEVRVTGVQPNVTAAALNVPDNVRQATIPAVRAESQRLGEGVWLIGGGSHNSVAVEFRDFVAVVEAPQNEQRSLAVIAEVTRLVPAKPIRYLVNTHHHFDHSGGLRTYVAHGATIVTHQMNKEFYERVSFYPAPRTLQPDMLAQFPGRTAFGAPPTIEAVQQRYALSDGRRTIELYPVVNLGHAGTMLIAYLPTEKILINADMYSPPAQGAQVAPAAVPGMIALNRNIQRLKLDVAQHVPIHGQPGTHEQFMRMVAAAGSSN